MTSYFIFYIFGKKRSVLSFLRISIVFECLLGICIACKYMCANGLMNEEGPGQTEVITKSNMPHRSEKILKVNGIYFAAAVHPHLINALFVYFSRKREKKNENNNELELVCITRFVKYTNHFIFITKYNAYARTLRVILVLSKMSPSICFVCGVYDIHILFRLVLIHSFCEPLAFFLVVDMPNFVDAMENESSNPHETRRNRRKE